MGANAFADAARSLKVARLIRYFDRRFTNLGFHPFTQAGEIAVMLRDKVGAEEWKQHGILAGTKKPGPDSVAMVIREYEERAKAAAVEPPLCRHTGTH